MKFPAFSGWREAKQRLICLRILIFFEDIFIDNFLIEKVGEKYGYFAENIGRKEQQDRGNVEVGQMHCRQKKNHYYD